MLFNIFLNALGLGILAGVLSLFIGMFALIISFGITLVALK
jgi:hypothetical protein